MGVKSRLVPRKPNDSTLPPHTPTLALPLQEGGKLWCSDHRNYFQLPYKLSLAVLAAKNADPT